MTTNKSAVRGLRVILCAILLLGVIGSLSQRTAHAAGTFIPAAERVDMVHDYARDMLYISAGSSVLRYELGTGLFLSPFELGGNLAGLDLSPDGSTLVVADVQYSDTDVWVHVVDLASGGSRKAVFPRAFGEGGTFTVAFGDDAYVLITSTYEGSGWVPMRRYNPATGEWSQLASVRQNTMLSSNADGSVIGFAESNSSDGPVGRYRVADGDLLRKSGYTDGTGAFNYEIGANRNGTQYAVPTYGGTFIFDANLAKIGTVGEYAGPQPIGVVYHPRADIVYFAWSGSTEVRAYDSTTPTQVAAYDFEYSFVHTNNLAFTQGRLKMSRDGSLLFATVEGGIRYVRLDALPVAFDQAVQTDEDGLGTVKLRAESGNGGALTYSILTNPQHGTLSGVAPDLTYTPAANYAGPDSFTFKVTEGTVDSNTATVTIDVRPVNDAPDAVNDVASTRKGTAVTIPVLANDTDVDVGNVLNITQVTQGAKGSVAINADGTVTYVPQRTFTGTDTFTYTIGDGRGGADTATVTVTVTRK
ncbi:MAG TPA: Ig-like domain-containing protein [Herpetosiphonaceae bacterium]|nr:Ig-like domain-containing protein [Herpetosiphonaceae bacterium]